MRHAPFSTFDNAKPFTARFAAPRVTWAGVALVRLSWLVGLPGRVAAIRRDMTLLGQMSAGELADIGLCRQDVWDAAALPLGEAPEPLLTRRAEQRRRAARAGRR